MGLFLNHVGKSTLRLILDASAPVRDLAQSTVINNAAALGILAHSLKKHQEKGGYASCVNGIWIADS